MTSTSFFLNLTPNNGCGFCNQIYSIVGVCRHANELNINYIFLSRYLMEIHGNNYCNISDIVNIDKTNQYLKQHNITLIDGNTFTFKIGSIKYGNKTYAIDLTDLLAPTCLNNKIISIDSTINLNKLKGDPYDFYKKSFFIDLSGPKSLFITYLINDIVFYQEFETTNGFLKSNVSINYRDLNYVKTIKSYNDGTPLFHEFVRRFVFSDTIVKKSQGFIQNNILNASNANKKINTIHLRLEEDAILHWGKESNYTDLKLYKSILEQNYIRIIQQFIEPDSITIILASDYDNNVVKFLRENKYNYIQTPNLDPHRDVSAIIDMHIGQTCNNVCIGVQESTFSYTLFFRSKPDVKKIILYYTNVQHPGSILSNE